VVTATSFKGDGSTLSNIPTSIVAGDNISISGGTGAVTITGLANTSNVSADTLVVSGVSTFAGITTADTSGIQVTGVVTATSFVGDGSGLTGITGIGNTFNTSTDTLNVVGVSTFNSGLTTFTSQGVDVTGIVTATSFSGPLTGNVTGNSDTATQLETSRNIGGVSFNGTADINLPGVNEAGNQNTSGTAAGLSGSPSITVTDITATGNVSIAGTLTYEDVTSVDSLGIVTARSGVHIGSPTGVAATLTSEGGAVLTGVVTATSFDGDGSDLTGIKAATGGGTDKVFLENQAVVNADYELSAGFNALSVGPITVSAGATVTVPANRRWVIL